jgi:hypothetical protein
MRVRTYRNEHRGHSNPDGLHLPSPWSGRLAPSLQDRIDHGLPGKPGGLFPARNRADQQQTSALVRGIAELTQQGTGFAPGPRLTLSDKISIGSSHAPGSMTHASRSRVSPIPRPRTLLVNA